MITITETGVEKIQRVADYLTEADSWDETLWEAFHKEGRGDTFCGDAKDLNRSFMIGAEYLQKDPDKFEAFDIGFLSGCGVGLVSLAEWAIELLD